MKRRSIHALTFLTLAALTFGQAKKLEPMRGLSRGQPQPPIATLLVGINEMVGSVAEPGWPLIVIATRQPDDQTAAVPFPTNLKVKLTDGNGAEVAIPFESTSGPAANTTSLYWLAAEATTARLSPGSFHVTLVPATGELIGWRIEPGEFQIVAPSPERSGHVGHLRIHRSVLAGRDDEALAEANRMIAANAQDKEAWMAKGDVFMLKDQPDAALQAYDHALSLHKKTDREPIAIMTRRRTALMRSLEKRGVMPPGNSPP